MANTVAQIFRAARERVGVTQSALAAEAGIAPNHLSRLESGAKETPRFDTVARVAAALGLSLDAIAVECGYRKPIAEVPIDGKNAVELAARLREVLRLLEDSKPALQSAIEQLDESAGKRNIRSRSRRP